MPRLAEPGRATTPSATLEGYDHEKRRSWSEAPIRHKQMLMPMLVLRLMLMLLTLIWAMLERQGGDPDAHLTMLSAAAMTLDSVKSSWASR